MRFEADLFNQLSGYAGLSALVGLKIYPDHVPQNVDAPYLSYLEIYRDKNYTYTGYTGTSTISIQISVFAPTRDQVRSVADEVDRSMDEWPLTNSKVGFAYQDNEVSTWREDLNLYEIDMDFDIFYSD
ncbi:MAG: DUF3168 domain-containing protein [Deltaproteobacteria bacterium]